MRNMALWSAAGASAVIAAITSTGSDAAGAVKWLVDLCLTGPADPDMPMIAMENHDAHAGTKLALGFGAASAAMITAGLLQGRGEGSDRADPDKMLAAMTYVAVATGGITPREFAQEVTRVTGMDLSDDEALLAFRTYTSSGDEEEMAWIGHEEGRMARGEIMRAALKIGWWHKEFTPGGLEMIGRLARVTDLCGDDLALLFWEATEPAQHERADRFERLRATSRALPADMAEA